MPLIFGILVLFAGKGNPVAARGLALGGTILTLIVSVMVWYCYGHAASQEFPGYSFVEKHSWIPSVHVNYLLGIDGISLLMVVMTTVIWPFAAMISQRDIKEREHQYYFWLLLLEAAVIGVFTSLDLVLYYVFWEAMLIPMYFIIGIWGGPKRIYATVKFFLYTMVGSMIMLVSILALYFAAGSTTFDLPDLAKALPGTLSSSKEMLLFLGFFLAFGIKAPVWPFHTWVPDAYSQAPTGGTIMLVALKMGLYGFIRFCLPLFPHAVHDSAPVIITMSVIGVIYAAWIAAMQTDLKRLLAYSSISHVGVIMLAIFALNGTGITGAVIQMVAHTVTMGALFIIVYGLYERRGSYTIADFGGLTKVMPTFTVVFLIAVLSSVALPTTAGFTGEFMMLIGAFQTYPWAAGFATTAAIWSVVYMLWMFQRVMYGKIDKPEIESMPDWQGYERVALVPLVALIFFLGVYPKPALDPVNASVNTILNTTGLNESASAKTLPHTVAQVSPAIVLKGAAQ